MGDRIRKWLVGAFLLGAMACLGAPSAQAQYPGYPQDRRDDDRRNNDRYERGRRDGSRGMFRDYQREIRFLEQRIQRDKQEVYLDSRRFGKHSFQAREAKARLKQDQRELKELKKEWKRAQKYDRRYYRWRY